MQELQPFAQQPSLPGGLVGIGPGNNFMNKNCSKPSYGPNCLTLHTHWGQMKCSDVEEMFERQEGMCYVCDTPLIKDEDGNTVHEHRLAPEMSRRTRKLKVRETLQIHHHHAVEKILLENKFVAGRGHAKKHSILGIVHMPCNQLLGAIEAQCCYDMIRVKKVLHNVNHKMSKNIRHLKVGIDRILKGKESMHTGVKNFLEATGMDNAINQMESPRDDLVSHMAGNNLVLQDHFDDLSEELRHELNNNLMKMVESMVEDRAKKMIKNKKKERKERKESNSADC